MKEFLFSASKTYLNSLVLLKLYNSFSNFQYFKAKLMVSSLTYFEPNVLQTNKHAEVKIRTAQTEASLLKFTEDTIILPRSLSAPALAL